MDSTYFCLNRFERFSLNTMHGSAYLLSSLLFDCSLRPRMRQTLFSRSKLPLNRRYVAGRWVQCSDFLEIWSIAGILLSSVDITLRFIILHLRPHTHGRALGHERASAIAFFFVVINIQWFRVQITAVMSDIKNRTPAILCLLWSSRLDGKSCVSSDANRSISSCLFRTKFSI